MTMRLTGKVSHFGGPEDLGVDADEGLAFIAEVEQQPSLFLPQQPPGTTGLARRLDPAKFYIACRWDYDEYPAFMLLENYALVRSTRTGKQFTALPSDWGPGEQTGRIADISPGLMSALGITTDSEVEVTFPYAKLEKPAMTYQSIVISSGHSTRCQGAVGILNEVAEATRVVDAVAKELKNRGVTVKTFHDTQSTSQNENLNRIVNYHNAQQRELDISVHFNASQPTDSPMGTECLWVSQSTLAGQVSAAIAKSGPFKDRGAKKRTDLFFLNNTAMPSILIEVCFVDSTADANLYKQQATFDAICDNIATVLGGAEEGETAPPPTGETTPPPTETPTGRVDIEVSGNVTVIVNGQAVTS